MPVAGFDHVAITVTDVEVVDGPVARPASNGTMGMSVSFRDPDRNLLELLTTDGDA